MRHLVKLLWFAAIAAGQTGDDPVVLRSETKLVQVSVVATDRKGEPVEGLQAADFTLLDRGKPQKIAFFQVDKAGASAARAVTLPPNVYSNRLGERVGVPTVITAILLDSLNTDWADQTQSQRQVVRFLRQVKDSDRVALYSLGRRLRILHDYTSDAGALIRKLDGYRGDLTSDLRASQVPPADAEGDVLGRVLESQQEAAFFVEGRVRRTLQALEMIAEHLAGVPGRKNLVWVSSAFPMIFSTEQRLPLDSMPARSPALAEMRSYGREVDAAMRAINQANVAIYPVDARGLMTDPRFGADQRSAPAMNAGWSPDNLDTMRYVADRTGGRAFFNTNDIEGAVRRAIDDSRVTYTLAYYPAENTDGKFHEIKVKVSRPGVSLRHRKGYTSFAERTPEGEQVSAELRQALWSPLDLTAVGVHARVVPAGADRLEVALQIEAQTVTLSERGGRWHGRIDIALVQRDDAGKQLDGLLDTINVALLPERYEQVRKAGILYQRAVVRKPGAAVMKLAVHDAPSGLTGTLTVPLAAR